MKFEHCAFQGAVYEPNPTLPYITGRVTVQTKGRIALHGERFCSY